MRKLFSLTILFFILISQPALSVEVYPFICPDDSFQALEDFINIGALTNNQFNQESSAHKLYLATYTFTSYPLAYDLAELRKKGVDIKILIDNYPVGGIPDKKILCFLEENNISVFLYQKPYRYMHAKYIIKDNSELLIVTENFGESGFPSNISEHIKEKSQEGESEPIFGNRGWGAVIENPETAEEFLEIFKKDVSTSKLFKCDVEYNISAPTKNKFQQTESEHIEFKKYSNQNIKTFFAPDNALESILELINSTMDFIYAEQFYIYKYWGSKKQQKPNQFLEALIEKARQGAEVKIMMDGSYYSILETDPKSNYNTMLYVNNIAENESLNLQAKLIDLKALNLQKLHAKVLVSDNSTMISSVNWNENSPLNNRESGVIITGDSSLFFKQAFLKDWNTGKLTEFSPTGMFIASPNLDIYIFIIIVSLAGFLAWLKKRKR